KMFMLVSAVITLVGCAGPVKHISGNRYEITANDGIPELLYFAPTLGCDTARERFEKLALKTCPNGFDKLGRQSQSGGTKSDPLCFIIGEVACRDASASEAIK
ncbi:MAG: hypothetical protein WCL71_18190, partial [Deltaproteobacteria bacterium]